jgi:hypothetical protein
MIKIVAYKSSAKDANFFDKLISFWTGCVYSHVLIIVGFTPFEVSPGDKKVVEYPTPYSFIHNPEKYDVYQLKIKLTDSYEEELKSFLRKELGKGYDWLGIFLSQILPLRRNDKNKWFCSEFVAYALNLTEKITGEKIGLRKQPQCYNPCALIKELKEKKLI